MRKTALATFIVTLSLVAASILGACSTDRPGGNTRTAVPRDMPGARNSAGLTGGNGAIDIAQPLPGTIVTNTVTVLGTGSASAGEYHVGVMTDGRYLAEETFTAAPNGSSGIFTVTLRFDPVTAPADGQVTVSTTSGGDGSPEQEASVPVKLAPANMKAISGPVIHLSPDTGKAGTPVVVMGEGFPPDRTVEIRLSGVSTEATEHAYVSGRTGAGGDFRLSFTMPAYWPNGDPIVSPQVLVVASTPDFVSKATAIFGYNSAVSPGPPTALPSEQPAPRVAEAFLSAWMSGTPGEALDYFSPDYGQRIASDGGVTEGIAGALGIQGTPTATSVAVVSASDEETVVRVTFESDTGSTRADITMQKAADGWQVVWIGPAGSEMR